MNPLLVICGPTGSGKSHLALALAQTFQGEIINCDSLQVFRGFNIGTAKLSPGEQSLVPHHLIDIREPTEDFTAGDFARTCQDLIPKITARRRLPIICGGTGFYLRALLRGLSPGPAADPALRARLSARNVHKLLTRLDPAAAQRIHANDTNKALRALEIRLLTGRPTEELYEQGLAPLTGYRVLQIGLNPPREALYSTLNDRCVRMWDGGLSAEATALLGRYPRTAKPFSSLGYKQVLAHFDGHLTKEEAIADMQIKTRHYAKRQLTWFRSDDNVQWCDDFGASPPIFDISRISTERFLRVSV